MPVKFYFTSSPLDGSAASTECLLDEENVFFFFGNWRIKTSSGPDEDMNILPSKESAATLQDIARIL